MPRRVSPSTAVLAVMAVAVVIGMVMIYGLLHGWGTESESEDQSSGKATGISSASPSPGPAAVMAADEAKQLEDGLVSNYRPTLNDVLAKGYKPPLAKSGTSVKIDRNSLRQYKSAGQVRAAVTEPGKTPMPVVLYMERIESDWHVHIMKEVK